MVKRKEVRLFSTPFPPARLGEVSRGQFDDEKVTSSDTGDSVQRRC